MHLNETHKTSALHNHILIQCTNKTYLYGPIAAGALAVFTTRRTTAAILNTRQGPTCWSVETRLQDCFTSRLLNQPAAHYANILIEFRVVARTHNTGVVSSIPPCVTFKTPLARKSTGNRLMNSTSLETTQSAVAGFSYARN